MANKMLTLAHNWANPVQLAGPSAVHLGPVYTTLLIPNPFQTEMGQCTVNTVMVVHGYLLQTSFSTTRKLSITRDTPSYALPTQGQYVTFHTVNITIPVKRGRP